jgi:hypothetical protein
MGELTVFEPLLHQGACPSRTFFSKNAEGMQAKPAKAVSSVDCLNVGTG